MKYLFKHTKSKIITSQHAILFVFIYFKTHISLTDVSIFFLKGIDYEEGKYVGNWGQVASLTRGKAGLETKLSLATSTITMCLVSYHLQNPF